MTIPLREMCDLIVAERILEKPDGSPYTAEEIHNSSPTGELYQIYEWYDLAMLHRLQREDRAVGKSPEGASKAFVEYLKLRMKAAKP